MKYRQPDNSPIAVGAAALLLVAYGIAFLAIMLNAVIRWLR